MVTDISAAALYNLKVNTGKLESYENCKLDMTCVQGFARLMNQRQHDSSYQALAMDSSPQLPSGTNYTTSTIVPRSNRRTTGRTVPARTSGIHGPGRLPAERR